MTKFLPLALAALLLALPALAQDSLPAAPKVPFGTKDYSWMNGQSRQREFPLSGLAGGVLALSLNVDTYFNYNFANPADNTQTISSTVGRHNEFVVNMASIGLEATYKGAIARVLLQTGAMASVIQDLDASVGRGAFLSVQNQKLIREATAGYHWDAWHGINFEMGIFMSYIGLESYMTYENWTYNRSLACDFTPFYFSGARLQVFPDDKWKIEPWLMNGFQTYGRFNHAPAAGLSVNYRPREWLALVANFYYGHDYFVGALAYGTQDAARRLHHDHSLLLRYVNRPGAQGVSRAALSLNNHYGLQSGRINEVRDATGNLLVAGAELDPSANYMAGTSLVNRLWFGPRGRMALTARGEYVTNPGRHIALYPIPGIGFPSTGTVVGGYAQQTPEGYDPASTGIEIWGLTAGLDFMPNDFVTIRLEYLHRGANMPYFTGRGGTTPTHLNTSGGVAGGTYRPDLQERENRFTFAINARI